VTTFVLATANPDKAREIAALLGDEAPSLELVARPPEVPDVDEVGETLEDNARIKAVALCAATSLPAVADDTGLHVDALGGAPGVQTARYSGSSTRCRSSNARHGSQRSPSLAGRTGSR
jgi:XTP/dITP diphosphohydrolase